MITSFYSLISSQVFFFCLNEPADGFGGETPLVKNIELISKLDPEVLHKFEEKQIRYVRYLPDKIHHKYMNWQHTFTTENKEVWYGLKVSYIQWFLCCIILNFIFQRIHI